MAILKWLAIGSAGLVAAVGLTFVAGALLSLDWSRAHAEATRQLPSFDGFKGRALVRLRAGAKEWRARIAGTEGPGVILLHGFPVTSAMYDPLLDAVEAAGYRAIAFDQRGYSPGARPAGAGAYTVPQLVADVLEVADLVGFDRFHLVGHDWGAVVGWGVTLEAPSRVRSWTALSIPHPAAFAKALETDPDQQRRSRYFGLFTTPWLPELLLSFGGQWLLRERLYAPMPRDAREEYLRMLAEPGALTAALSWYRAMSLRGEGRAELERVVERPTLFVWGSRDPAVARAGVEGQRAYLGGPYREIELDTDHWLLEQEPDRVVEAILAHWEQHPEG